MSIVKRIKKISLITLGCQAERWDDVWDQMGELSEAFGEREVADIFQEWAETRRGEMFTRPLAEFLKVAPGLLQGITSLKPDTRLVQLVNELVFMSNGQITFDKEQQVFLGRMLSSWNDIDIKSAFREFYGQISGDDFALKHAARKFVETAEQLLTLQKRRKEEARKQSGLLVQIADKERANAEQELAEIEKRQQDEQMLVEDSLG